MSILVGHGAKWLLYPDCGLRVRMIAPLPMRVDQVAQEEGLTLARALTRIQEDDASRAHFIRQVYRKDIEDPAGTT